MDRALALIAVLALVAIHHGAQYAVARSLRVPMRYGLIFARTPQPQGWRRLAALLSGSAANFAVAAVLTFAVLLVAGSVVGGRYRIAQVMAGAPADGRLQPGDTLLALDGQDLWVGGAPLQARLEGREHRFTVRRAGAVEQVAVTPAHDGQAFRIGVALDVDPVRESPGFLGAAGQAALYPIRQARSLASVMIGVWFGDSEAELVGPVGIVDVVARAPDWIDRIQLIALTSIYVGLIYLLLDGVRVLLLAADVMAARRRKSE